jgi:hypothetical protein
MIRNPVDGGKAGIYKAVLTMNYLQISDHLFFVTLGIGRSASKEETKPYYSYSPNFG